MPVCTPRTPGSHLETGARGWSVNDSGGATRRDRGRRRPADTVVIRTDSTDIFSSPMATARSAWTGPESRATPTFVTGNWTHRDALGVALRDEEPRWGPTTHRPQARRALPTDEVPRRSTAQGCGPKR